LGHGSEQTRVGDAVDNAFAETNHLAHCELLSLLVDQAKLTSTRVNDAWKAIDQLVKIQPGLNEALVPRVDNVDHLLRSSLPELIMRVKDVLVQGATPDRAAAVERAHQQIKSCLEELRRILALVTANYVNQFEESATRIPLDRDPLEQALRGVSKCLADIKGAQLAHEPEMLQLELANLLPEFVKVAIAELTKMGASEADKREFIDAVKKARDGNADDFFKAQETFDRIKDRIKNKPPPLQIGLVEAAPQESRAKDLLEAAKRMAAAMGKVNVTLNK